MKKILFAAVLIALIFIFPVSALQLREFEVVSKTDRSITFNATTDVPTIITLYYSNDTYYQDKAAKQQNKFDQYHYDDNVQKTFRSFTIIGLSPETLYHFQLYYQAGVQGAQSPEKTVQTPADIAPLPVVLSSPAEVNSSSMKLVWEKNFETDFDSYRLYSDTSAGVSTSSKLVAILNSSEDLSYTDSKLAQKTTYYYKVFVFDKGGLSAESNEVFATTIGSDIVAPSVNKTIPLNDTAIVTTANFTIVFSEPMERVSTNSAISISPVVSVDKIWNTGNTSITIKAKTAFIADTNYKIVVGTGAKDLSENAIDKQYIFAFSTSTPPPTVILPANATTTTQAVTTTTEPAVTEDEALSAINAANETINSLRDTKNISTAFDVYTTAVDDFNAGNYASAKSKAEEAKNSAENSPPLAKQPEGINFGLILGILIAVIIAGAAVYFLFLRKPTGQSKPPQTQAPPEEPPPEAPPAYEPEYQTQYKKR